MLLGSLLDELFNYEMFMELLEGIWGLLALLWQLLKIIVSFAGVLLLMYGISYWFDIRSSLKSYKKAHQDSLKKINELENSEKLSRKSYWDSFDKIKELEDDLKYYRKAHQDSFNKIKELVNPNLEYHSPTYLKKYAQIYHESFDFNISCISSKINQYNINENVLKAPNHEWVELQKSRQSKSELNNYSWHEATGLGIILGYNGIRALDIDNCEDFSLVDVFLKELALPVDYEWVIKSGSQKGFHVLFYCDDYERAYDADGRVSYHSKKDFNFEKIDLMWDGHLVLPPTIHKENYNYTFLFVDTRIAFFEDKIPKNQPKKVDKKNVDILLKKITEFKRRQGSY